MDKQGEGGKPRSTNGYKLSGKTARGELAAGKSDLDSAAAAPALAGVQGRSECARGFGQSCHRLDAFH